MTTYSTGDPCWIDLMTDSLDRSRAFYGQLFGWTFTDAGAEFGHYNRITLGEASIGGAMENAAVAAGLPPELADLTMGNYWSIYLDTPDADGVATRARNRGARLLGEPMQVGPLGRSLEVLHPAIGLTGAWQPLEFAGTGVLAAPGAPCWFELHTSLFTEAVDLLADVFEWDVTVTVDTPEFRYAQHHGGDGGTAGVYDTTRTGPGAPEADPGTPTGAAWTTYFGTVDVDASASLVTALGGTVLVEPSDSPYGRMAAVADDQGATFSLVQTDGGS